MKYVLLVSILIVPLIFLSGCTTTQVGSGLFMSLYSDPQTMFGDDITTLYIDIDNRDTKTIDNVIVTAFDTGILEFLATEDWQYRYEGYPVCQKEYNNFAPSQFDTFSCKLHSPVIELPSLRSDIYVKATFDTEFAVVQVMEMMTLDEYIRKTASGKFVPRPESYSYRDKYVELQLEFSEQLPIVVRENKKYFVYFTVRNIGNGFIGNILSDDFYIEQQGNIIQCNPDSGIDAGGITYLIDNELEPIGNKFPRVACEVLLPDDVNYLINYDFTVRLRYGYEIRDKTTINIIR